MKNIKRISYLLLITVSIIVIIFISLNIFKDKKVSNKERIKTEIDFLEEKIIKLINKMNNIEIENYKVKVSKIPNKYNEEKKNSDIDNENESKSGDNKKEIEIEKKKDNKEEKNKEIEETAKNLFELKKDGILTDKEDIDWNQIKKEIEILYNSIPTIILDLYEDGIVEKEILNLNNELDELTIKVKEKDKKEILRKLADIYKYIIEFTKKARVGQVEEILIETKSKVFYAYSKLEDKNWDEILKYMNESIEIYSKLLTDVNIEKEKQYKIKKGYIMINELKNSIKLQDETIFLIKYKNLLEEINNM